jgi:hypothetical protein
MLHILTDEQISPDVAVAARKLCRTIRITALSDWVGGHFIGAPDHEILREAARQKMTLVSFDLRTIPSLLRSWGERATDHAGLIFVDERTIAQHDIGGMARALCEVWKQLGAADWTNRTFFLRPAGR